MNPRLLAISALALVLAACGTVAVPLEFDKVPEQITLREGEQQGLLLRASTDGRDIPLQLSAAAPCVSTRVEGQSVILTADRGPGICLLTVEGRNLNAVGRVMVPLVVEGAVTPVNPVTPVRALGFSSGSLELARGGEAVRVAFSVLAPAGSAPVRVDRWEVEGAGALEVTVDGGTRGGAVTVSAPEDATLGSYRLQISGFQGGVLVAEGALQVSVRLPQPDRL